MGLAYVSFEPFFGKPHTSGTNLLHPCKPMANKPAGAPFAVSSFYLSDQIVESHVQVAGSLSYTVLVEPTDTLPPHYMSDHSISTTATLLFKVPCLRPIYFFDPCLIWDSIGSAFCNTTNSVAEMFTPRLASGELFSSKSSALKATPGHSSVHPCPWSSLVDVS